MAEQMPPEQNIHLALPPELEDGVYANYALVHHSTEHEITIDFCQIGLRPSPPEGGQVAKVVARVHIAPSFVTPLLRAINENAFRQEETLKKLEDGQFEEGESDEP
jgi:hypothetical protein